MRAGPTAQPVTANDFVYAWRRQVDPATGSEYAQALAPIENAMDIASGKMPVDKLGVEAAGPQTLDRSSDTRRRLICWRCLPTPTSIRLRAGGEAMGQRLDAAGPHGLQWPVLLSERVLNGHITLLKNPNYWDASHVRLSQGELLILVDDSTAAMNQYLAGDLDFTDRIPTSEKERLQQLVGDQVVLAPYFATVVVQFQSGEAALCGQSEAAAGADHGRGPRHSRRNTCGMASGCRPTTSCRRSRDTIRPFPIGRNFRRTTRHALARKLYQEAGYSDSHPLETVLTYPSGWAGLSPRSWKRWRRCGR